MVVSFMPKVDIIIYGMLTSKSYQLFHFLFRVFLQRCKDNKVV